MEEGRERVHRKWKEWNNRRLEAQAAGTPFKEPPQDKKNRTKARPPDRTPFRRISYQSPATPTSGYS